MISSVCPICGVIKRSGKMSCCGRGGSWFGKCGSAGSTKLDHTWYEGLQACKARAQSKTVIGQQLNGVQQERNESSQGVGRTISKAGATVANPFAFTLAPVSDAAEISALVNKPTDTSRASVTLKKNKSTSRKVTTTISASESMSRPTSSIKTGAADLVDTPVTSHGCNQLFSFTVYISVSLTVAVSSPHIFAGCHCRMFTSSSCARRQKGSFRKNINGGN